jgi:hypothetical protein
MTRAEILVPMGTEGLVHPYGVAIDVSSRPFDWSICPCLTVCYKRGRGAGKLRARTVPIR